MRVMMLLAMLAGLAQADRIRDYHEWQQACVNAKDAGTIDGYIAKFRQCLDSNPGDHLARVNLGSAYTLRSAETFWGPKKFDYLKKGGKLMDEAVTAAPNDARVRFLRAANAFRVPQRFGRRQVAVADFEILLPVAIQGGQGLSVRERQAMLYFAWQTFAEEGKADDAEKARSACHRLDPQSGYGQKAAG